MTIGLTKAFEHGSAGAVELAQANGRVMLVGPKTTPAVGVLGAWWRAGVPLPLGTPVLAAHEASSGATELYKVQIAVDWFHVKSGGGEGNLSPASGIVAVSNASAGAREPYNLDVGYVEITLTALAALTVEAAKYPSGAAWGRWDALRVWARLYTIDGELLTANWHQLQVFADPDDPGEPLNIVPLALAGAGALYAQVVPEVIQEFPSHPEAYFRPREGVALAAINGAFFIGGSSGFEDTALTATRADEPATYGQVGSVSVVTLSSPVAEPWWEGKTFRVKQDGAAVEDAVITRVVDGSTLWMGSVMAAFTDAPFAIFGNGCALQVLWPVERVADSWMGESLESYLEPEDGGRIVALATCVGGLAVYKTGPRPRTYIIRFLGGIPYPVDSLSVAGVGRAISVQRIAEGFAAINQGSAVVGLNGENYVFGGRLGFRMVDGARTHDISSDQIRFSILNEWDEARFDTVRGWLIPDTELVCWWIPKLEGGDTVIVFDPRKGLWYDWPPGAGAPGPRCGFEALNEEGRREFLLGQSDGDLGARGGTTDNGGAITWLVARRLLLKAAGPFRLMRLARVRVRTDAADWTLQLQFFFNANKHGATPDVTRTVTKSQAARMDKGTLLELPRHVEPGEVEIRGTGTTPAGATYFHLIDVEVHADA